MKPLNERTKLSRYTSTGRDLSPLAKMPYLPKERAKGWVMAVLGVAHHGAATHMLTTASQRLIAADGGPLVKPDWLGNYQGCGTLSDAPDSRPWLALDTALLLDMLEMTWDADDPFSKGSLGEHISDTFGVTTYEAVCDLFNKARYLNHIHRDDERGIWVGGPAHKPDVSSPKRLGGRPTVNLSKLPDILAEHGGVVTRANESAVAEAAGCSIRTLWRAWKKLKETTKS